MLRISKILSLCTVQECPRAAQIKPAGRMLHAAHGP